MPGRVGFRMLTTAVILAELSHPVAGENGRPEIVVEVFNHASVPAETLARAKDDVSRIYSQVGVDIRWRDAAGMDEDRFVVHLIIKSKPPRPRVMGTA